MIERNLPNIDAILEGRWLRHQEAMEVKDAAGPLDDDMPDAEDKEQLSGEIRLMEEEGAE